VHKWKIECEKTLAIFHSRRRRSRKCSGYWIYSKFDAHRCPLHSGSWPHIQGRFASFTLVAFLLLRGLPLSFGGCSVSCGQSMECATISVVKMQQILGSSPYKKRGFVLIFTHISSLLFIFLITLNVHSSFSPFILLFYYKYFFGFIGFLIF